MASPISADLLTAVEDEAVEIVMMVLKGVVDEMQADGRVYGDVDLDRGQRILSYQHAVDSGEMYSLPAVKPELAREMTAQYERDIKATPVYTGRR